MDAEGATVAAAAAAAPSPAFGEGATGQQQQQQQQQQQHEMVNKEAQEEPEEKAQEEEDRSIELVEGGNVRVALPATMLETCTSLGDVLNVDTWREVLDGAERDALRAMLPDPKASDQDVEALLAKLFDADPSSSASASAQATGSATTDAAAPSSSLPSERYFHFGNPAGAFTDIAPPPRHESRLHSSVPLHLSHACFFKPVKNTPLF